MPEQKKRTYEQDILDVVWRDLERTTPSERGKIQKKPGNGIPSSNPKNDVVNRLINHITTKL